MKLMNKKIAQPVYNLSHLRGNNDELTRLRELCTHLTKQNAALERGNELLKSHIGIYFDNVVRLAPDSNIPKRDPLTMTEGELSKWLNSIDSVRTEIVEVAREIEVPVFVESKLRNSNPVVEKIEVPVEVERIIEV